MEPEFKRPCKDRAFQYIFADPNELEPLRKFLAATIDLPAGDLDIITIQDPQAHPHQEDDKAIIFDVRVDTSSERKIEVEIQLIREVEFTRRLAYYASSMLANQLKKGEKYQQLRQAITVAITDFTLTELDDDRYHHRFHLYDDESNRICLTDILEINLLEIPKLPEQNDGTLLWAWLRFIGSHNYEEMQQAMMLDTTINLAGQRARTFAREDDDSWYARRELVTELDAKAQLDYAHDEGLTEGAHAKQLEIAQAMLTKGIPPETVAELAQLTIDEVTELLQGS